MPSTLMEFFLEMTRKDRASLQWPSMASDTSLLILAWSTLLHGFRGPLLLLLAIDVQICEELLMKRSCVTSMVFHGFQKNEGW